MRLDIVAVGDSVIWGQGLEREQKSITIAFSRLRNELGFTSGNLTSYARSGAIISELPQHRDDDDGDYTKKIPDSVDFWPELPHPTPTILQQVTPIGEQVPSVTSAQPAGFSRAANTGVLPLSSYSRNSVDIVILDGGINDVSGKKIAKGDFDREELTKVVSENCHDDMLVLIRRVRESFPKAVIVVCGYHRVLSDETDANLLKELVKNKNIVGVIEPFLSKKQFSYFHLRQLADLRTAVTDFLTERATSGKYEPGTVFADPAYDYGHAMYTSDTHVFDSGEDPVFDRRQAACEAFDPESNICPKAHLFHPNEKGSQRLSAAIYNNSLEFFKGRSLRGVVASEAVTSVRRRSTSWGLSGDLSLSQLFNLRTVDVIEIDFTAAGSGFGDLMGDLYVLINGDRFLVKEYFANTTIPTSRTFTVEPNAGKLTGRLKLKDVDSIAVRMPQGESPWKVKKTIIRVNGHELLTINSELTIRKTQSTHLWPE